MAVQILDYSLLNFQLPGLSQYTLPFGTKKANGKGLTTSEIARNEGMPFLKQRPISGIPLIPGNDPPIGVISEDSIAQPIEFDANFAVAEEVTLQLDDPSYEGQSIKITASFTIGNPAIIILGITGTPETVSLEGEETLHLFAVNGKWKINNKNNNARINVVEKYLSGGLPNPNREIGTYRYYAYEPSPLTLAKKRHLPLQYQIIETALYQDLCDFMYCGDLENDAALWWYKCDEFGSRDIEGLYMRVEASQGMFYRGAGVNPILTGANDAPYDGKGVGEVIYDAMRNFTGRFTYTNSSLNSPSAFQSDNGVFQGFGLTNVVPVQQNDPNPGDIFANISFNPARVVPVADENRPVSISGLTCITY